MKNLTKHQIENLMKSMDSIEYFAENFVKTIHPVNGLIGISLTDDQKEVIRLFEGKHIFSKCMNRQIGKTTIASIILLHQAIFNNHKTIAIFAPKQQISNYVLDTTMIMYEKLPEYFKVGIGITTKNKSKIEFENGSRLISFGSNFLSSKGMTINTAYIDESEYVKNLKDFRDFLYPCIASYGKMFALYSSLSSEIFSENNV